MTPASDHQTLPTWAHTHTHTLFYRLLRVRKSLLLTCKYRVNQMKLERKDHYDRTPPPLSSNAFFSRCLLLASLPLSRKRVARWELWNLPRLSCRQGTGWRIEATIWINWGQRAKPLGCDIFWRRVLMWVGAQRVHYSCDCFNSPLPLCGCMDCLSRTEPAWGAACPLPDGSCWRSDPQPPRGGSTLAEWAPSRSVRRR